MGNRKMNKPLVMRYLEWQLIVVSVIAPHFSEHCWGLMGKEGSVLDARFPEPTAPVDSVLAMQGAYIFDKVQADFINLKTKACVRRQILVARRKSPLAKSWMHRGTSGRVGTRVYSRMKRDALLQRSRA